MATTIVGFARDVANQVLTDPVEVEVGIDWISLVMSLIAMLPCFKPKTPAEKRQWIESHPNMARNQLIASLRAKSPEKLKRKDARPIADRILEDTLSLSDEEFAKLCEEVG